MSDKKCLLKPRISVSFHKERETEKGSERVRRYLNPYLREQRTLLADVLYGGGELLFEELAFLGDLLAFLQEVLRGALHRGGQNVGLFGAALLFVGWAFVARVHQSGHLDGKTKALVTLKTTGSSPVNKQTRRH